MPTAHLISGRLHRLGAHARSGRDPSVSTDDQLTIASVGDYGGAAGVVRSDRCSPTRPGRRWDPRGNRRCANGSSRVAPSTQKQWSRLSDRPPQACLVLPGTWRRPCEATSGREQTCTSTRASRSVLARRWGRSRIQMLPRRHNRRSAPQSGPAGANRRSRATRRHARPGRARTPATTARRAPRRRTSRPTRPAA
jgi:hypothetical protein